MEYNTQSSIYDLLSTKMQDISNTLTEQDAKTLIPLAKKAIFGEKGGECNFTNACKTFDYIVTELLHLEKDQFISLYNTKVLKTMRIKNLEERIIQLAPISLYEECCFDRKRILIASVWNEYYHTHFKPLTQDELFFCSGDLKGCLMRAASSKIKSIYNGDDITTELKKDATFKKKRTNNADTVYGAMIDKIAYNCIDAFLDKMTLDFDDKLSFLASYKTIFKSKGLPIPGIFAVIDNRGCYACALDFYMFNSPADLQVDYIHDYMEIRKDSKEKPLPVIDLFYQAFVENEENDKFNYNELY